MMDKEQVNPDDHTELVLVSQFQGAPVYRVVAKANSTPESAATIKENSQGIPEDRQLEMQDPIDDSSRVPPPPREPHPRTQVRIDADLDAGIIPAPIPPFPNITQGQAILGYTNSQWSFLYIRAQELVKPFAGRHAQTTNTPIHLRAENSVEILGPLLEEFPDLQRCEDNWGAKWIVRKARHAVSVKGASERRRSLKPSLKTMASSASVAESQEVVGKEKEEEKEEEREDDSEDDIEAAEDERRDNDSVIHSPVVGQAPAPDWHKYMTPKYTQGRGPSIYGLTKPIIPFVEPTAGPPSMRHSSSDLDSSRSLATKRRGKRLPRPNPPSPSQASTTGEPVIINPDHPVMSGPTKHLSAVNSESSAVRRTVGFTIPKANRHMSTPVLSMSEDSPKEVDSHDPMQMDEKEEHQGTSSRYPKAVSESPQKISADQGSAKHTMDDQYTDKRASETLVLPPIRGVLPDPDFGFDQEKGDQPRMLPFSNGSRARPGFVNSFPRFDQLAGSSVSDGDGKISIINRDPGPLMSPFNRDPYGTFGRGNTNNGAPNFQNGGQGGFNGAQGVPHAEHYHQESFYHNSGIYANGLPVNPYGFIMNQGQYYGGTAQGGPSLYAVAGPNGPGNNGHGITDPRNSVNTPLNIQPYPVYNHIAGNNNLYHQPSYDWNVQNLYGAASSGSNAIENEAARTNVDGARLQSREVTPRVSRGKGGTRSRGQLRHASTWSGNPY